MVLALVACGNDSSTSDTSSDTTKTDSTDTSTSTDTDTASDTNTDADTVSGDYGPYPDASADGGMGFYLADYDYSSNKTFKVAYMYAAQSLLNQNFSDAFAAWAERMNIEYNDYNSNSDADAFCNTIETYASQGYDGLLLDPDSQTWARVVELANEVNIPWFPCMSCPVDDDGKTAAPRVGFDNYNFGELMMQACLDWLEETYPDVALDKVGVISIDYSASVEIHQRTEGALDTWLAYGGSEDNFTVADGVAQGDMSSESGYNAAAPIVSSNPDIEVWLVCACIDDYALGSAQCLADNDKADHAYVTTCGGTGLQLQWDQGTQTCWRSAIYTAQELYAEPIINSLYALMNGWITHETLWPEWINHAAGDEYASYRLPTFKIEYDTYQEYLEFVDSYTGMDHFDYEYNGTQFPLRGEIPDSYNA
jgi:ABC-type sugar transport system substrate-binding protein